MNLAAIWRLPVIYLCESNQLAVTTRAQDAVGGGSIAARAAGYGMKGVVVEDGQEVEAGSSTDVGAILGWIETPD